MKSLFPSLPDAARVWIYTADRALGPTERATLLDAIGPFLAAWSSHRRPVLGEAAVLEDRFLVVAAHVADGDLSGCGIDKSVHEIEQLGSRFGIAWRGALDVAWRNEKGEVEVSSRADFRSAIGSGRVGARTPVFDTSITELGAFRSTGFPRPAAESWHGRVFRIVSEPSGTIPA